MKHQTEGPAGAPIISQVIKWYKAERNIALATVVRTWGSSPCPVGSHLAVRDDGAFQGSVSGGCIEGEVITEALASIREGGGYKTLNFGVADEDAWLAGLACGGKISVFIKAIDDDTIAILQGLEMAIHSGKVTALLADQASGLYGLWVEDSLKTKSLQMTASHIRDLKARFVLDSSGIVGEETYLPLFARVYNSHLRMLIIGAVHIAQSLAEFAARSGYDVTVMDPRDTWSTDERFPGVKLDHRWPSTALKELQPDARTAIITLSHDPKLDDPALLAAFETKAFYIGCLGSRKTHAARLKRLRQAGVSEDQIGRIYAPVGLNIGAENPAEIAVAIMAQVTQALRR